MMKLKNGTIANKQSNPQREEKREKKEHTHTQMKTQSKSYTRTHEAYNASHYIPQGIGSDNQRYNRRREKDTIIIKWCLYLLFGINVVNYSMLDAK